MSELTSSSSAKRIALRAHPSTPSGAVQELDMRVDATAAGRLIFEYWLQADLRLIRLPASETAGRADKLWQHTCFEAFIRWNGSQEYVELNFSPSGQWAAYHFDAYREGMSNLRLDADPEICVRRLQQGLQLDAVVHLPRRPMKLAVAAVIEEDSGRLSYWAARHPPGRPDFHHSDGFAFEL